jgi:hypothetical protein
MSLALTPSPTPITRRKHGATRRVALALLALFGLAACKIVDQTTFGARPQKPQPDMLTRALMPGPPVPLVTIVFNGGEVAYEDQLRAAVLMAEGRHPGLQYDLVTVVPARGTPSEQEATAKAGSADAVGVADEMDSLGVDPAHIHFSARTDPNVNARELRIYVRA